MKSLPQNRSADNVYVRLPSSIRRGSSLRRGLWFSLHSETHIFIYCWWIGDRSISNSVRPLLPKAATFFGVFSKNIRSAHLNINIQSEQKHWHYFHSLPKEPSLSRCDDGLNYLCSMGVPIVFQKGRAVRVNTEMSSTHSSAKLKDFLPLKQININNYWMHSYLLIYHLAVECQINFF